MWLPRHTMPFFSVVARSHTSFMRGAGASSTTVLMASSEGASIPMAICGEGARARGGGAHLLFCRGRAGGVQCSLPAAVLQLSVLRSFRDVTRCSSQHSSSW